MERYEDQPDAFIQDMKSRAVFSDVYRFFDTTIAMKSDRADMLERFRHLYSCFRLTNIDEDSDAIFYIMAEMSKTPFVATKEKHNLRIKKLDNENSAVIYAYLLALNYMAANAKSHFLIHAAAVSWNGNGLGIIAPSYHGKTSLALYLLLRKGFGILSDDQLAINRTTHLVDPYPKRIGIREKTLTFFDEIDVGQQQPYIDRVGQREWLLDVSDLPGNSMGESCSLKCIVFLKNSFDKMGTDRRNIELILDDISDELLEELRAISLNDELHCRDMGGLYSINFQSKAEADLAAEIERICEDCGTQLLSLIEDESVDSDFSLTPQIQSISWHEAVMELINGLQNDFRNTPIRTFLELAEILENVEFYQLSIGKLDEMGGHIWNLIASDNKSRLDKSGICD